MSRLGVASNIQVLLFQHPQSVAAHLTNGRIAGDDNQRTVRRLVVLHRNPGRVWMTFAPNSCVAATLIGLAASGMKIVAVQSNSRAAYAMD